MLSIFIFIKRRRIVLKLSRGAFIYTWPVVETGHEIPELI